MQEALTNAQPGIQAGPGQNNDFTDAEAKLLAALPAGRENAVGLYELARRTGMSQRHMRDLIVHLICDHGIGIGSDTASWCGGYFLIQDVEDMRAAVRHLVPRVKQLARRVKSLEKIADEKFGGQARLFDE